MSSYSQISLLSRAVQIVRQRPFAIGAIISTALLLTMIVCAASARPGNRPRLNASAPTTPPSGQPGGPPVYNPYPPGILPSDLDAEVSRVRAEVRTIFGRYVTQWQALGPVTYSNTQGVGNPPTIQGSGDEAMRILGGLLNYDENISPLRNQACASCHLPYAGFSGPIPSVNLTMIAYPGTYHYRAGSEPRSDIPTRPFFPACNSMTSFRRS
jgi:hypothetical protein